MFGFFKNLVTGRRNIYVLRQTEEKIQNDWKKIDELLSIGKPSQLKQALITADRSLDTALRDIMDGETMGERLKGASNRFDKDQYNKIWQAHKMRNSLVHESDFDPPHFILIEHVNVLKKALQSIGVKL